MLLGAAVCVLAPSCRFTREWIEGGVGSDRKDRDITRPPQCMLDETRTNGGGRRDLQGDRFPRSVADRLAKTTPSLPLLATWFARGIRLERFFGAARLERQCMDEFPGDLVDGPAHSPYLFGGGKGMSLDDRRQAVGPCSRSSSIQKGFGPRVVWRTDLGRLAEHDPGRRDGVVMAGALIATRVTAPNGRPPGGRRRAVQSALLIFEGTAVMRRQ